MLWTDFLTLRSGDRSQSASLGLLPLEPRLLFTAVPLITEFLASNQTGLTDEDGDTSDWIELHNAGDTALDLAGWHLTDSAADPTQWTFPSVSLAPGAYVVVFASNKDRADADGTELHTNFALSAAGEYLALTSPTSDVVFAYDAFDGEYPPQSADRSYGLDALGNSVFFDTPTPGSANPLGGGPSGGVMISEIMYHPASENDLEEYIELYNPTATAVDLTGWQFVDGVSFTFPAATIDPGGYLVVAADTTAFAAVYPGVGEVVGGWTGRLSNASETIRLADAAGQTVDLVTYADEGDWAQRERGPDDVGHFGWVWSDAHDGLGRSLELVNSALPNDYGANWSASAANLGTPGSVNSVTETDSAPLILEATHFPVIPGSTDPVTVTARILDESMVGVSASAFYRVDGAPVFTEVALFDDGLHGDGAAGDGLFGGALPPQADATVVEFYIQASDALGHTRTAPNATQPSGLQEANLLYQVDDSFDPNAVFLPGDMPSYRLIMTEAERAELQQIGSNPVEGYSRAQMNGTLISINENGVQLRYNVGIRNRGESSRDDLPNSYRVNLASDRPWEGVTAFNLNTQFTHNQLAGLLFFAEAGLVAEDAAAVLVTVNGADLSLAGSPSYGVYVQIEAANSEFASNHFPGDDNGNLYSAKRTSSGNDPADLSYLGTDPDDYREIYQKQTNTAEDDFSDLIQLVDVLNNTPDAMYLEAMSQVVNIEQWLTYFAVNAILGNDETSLATGFGDDYILYRGIEDTRFVLIPHDMDTILGEGESNELPTGTIYPAVGNPVMARFFSQPEIAARYHAILHSLLVTVFSKERFDASLDAWIGAFAPASNIADMKAYMDARRAYILGEINAPLTVTSELPLVGGFHQTEQNIAALSGTAPLSTTGSVLVNGQPADYDPVTGQWAFGETLGGEALTLIATGSVWQYLDAGQVPPTTPGNDWRVDDPGWTQSGPAQLGYGDGDEQTIVSFIDTDPGTAGTQRNITTYFRTTFNLTDAASITAATIELLRDDGAVVYLNGVELFRTNMPAGVITDTTTALQAIGGSTDENAYHSFVIDPGQLVEGVNVLAVEIHQAGPTSSDISFDLGFTAVRGDPAALSGLGLRPGINRITVQATSQPDGLGEVLETALIDVWYDTGVTQAVSGVIDTDTTWTVAGGPYLVTGDLTVTAGATLTIEPGVTVFFQAGTGMTVNGEARVLAEGTPFERIRFTYDPLTGTGWDGLRFEDTDAESRLTYIDMEAGDGQGEAMYIDHARLLIDHAAWFGSNRQVLNLFHTKLTVSHSDIPGISGDETVHLVGLEANDGEFLIFDDNVFGRNTSGDDVIDLSHSTLTPATIIFRNNTFLGGFDDGIDTDGFPVLIENNFFTDFHLDSARPTTSNAVSTGRVEVGGEIISSDVTLIGNIFFDVDHALLLKDFASATLMNNTIVGATIGAIQLSEPGGTSVIGPGASVHIDGVLFWDNAALFANVDPATVITLDRSIVPAEYIGLGTGNLAADPLLADPAGGDFSVLAGSPALLAGPDGTDIGAVQAPRFETLRISELHYHPAGPTPAELAAGFTDADQFEFIELVNTSDAQKLDLGGVAFVDGISFSFAEGTTLLPGERLVLVADLDAFVARYGTGVEVAGVYSGQLSNGGELIELVSPVGLTIQSFTFGTAAQPNWPTTPDGDGPSLVVIDTDADYNDSNNWAASSFTHGTPGTDETQSIPGDITGDGYVGIEDLDALLMFWGDSAASSAGADAADLNQDGTVGSPDLDIVLANFGQGLPPSTATSNGNVPDDPVATSEAGRDPQGADAGDQTGGDGEPGADGPAPGIPDPVGGIEPRPDTSPTTDPRRPAGGGDTSRPSAPTSRPIGGASGPAVTSPASRPTDTVANSLPMTDALAAAAWDLQFSDRSAVAALDLTRPKRNEPPIAVSALRSSRDVLQRRFDALEMD